MTKDNNDSVKTSWPELDQLVLDEIMALQKAGTRLSGDEARHRERRPGRKTGKMKKSDLACLHGQVLRPLPAAVKQTMDDPVEEDSTVLEEGSLETGVTVDSDDEPPVKTALMSDEEKRFLDQTVARLKMLGNVDMLMAELWRRVTVSVDEDFFQPPETDDAEDAADDEDDDANG